jgi:hypothetical protein
MLSSEVSYSLLACLEGGLEGEVRSMVGEERAGGAPAGGGAREGSAGGGAACWVGRRSLLMDCCPLPLVARGCC